MCVACVRACLCVCVNLLYCCQSQHILVHSGCYSHSPHGEDTTLQCEHSGEAMSWCVFVRVSVTVPHPPAPPSY